MATKIEVLKFFIGEQGGGNGKRPYKVAEVAYSADGKTKGMKVLAFAQPEVFKALEAINPKQGDILDVQFSQNDKGYWQFASVEKGAASAGTSSNTTQSASSPARGNWETPDERAQRQIMIVRQSSISSAVALSEAQKAKKTPADIIEDAKIFEAYVLGTTPAVEGDDVV